MKRELIYVTGDLEIPFFYNEIGVMSKEFDQVHVIVYKSSLEKSKEMANKYNFTYDYVYDNRSMIKIFFNMFRIIPFKEIRKEVFRISSLNVNKLRCLAYMFFYVWHASKVDLLIKNRVANDKELFLYSFWLSRPAFSIAVQKKYINRGIRYIASRTHRYDLYEEENNYNYLPFREFLSKNLDAIYFTSEDSKKYFSNKNYSKGSLHAEYKMSHIGTIPHDYSKRVKEKKEIVLASCSNMIYRKRLDLIIRFLSSSVLEGKMIKWIHIGDGELENEVKRCAEKLPSNIKVNFTGRINDEEIFTLYEAEDIDFFINMSDSEGTPVSVMEALSLGIPCIARCVGGNEELVVDNYNGFLIKKDAISGSELNDLCTRVVSVFDDKKCYKRMSVNAYQHWNSYFNTNKNTKRMCREIIHSAK